MTLVITGASGFLGHHLIASELAKGQDVIALTRDARKIEPRPGLRIVQTDYATLDLPAGATVVHLAAVRNAPGNRPTDMRRVNVELAERVARAAAARRVARFIHLGSALVLGASREPLDGSAPLTTTDDPYVTSKIDGLRALEAMDGLPLITILPAIVYGPDHPLARNRITSHMRRVLARPFRFAMRGAAAPRNLVYVDDVVRAIAAPSGVARQLVAGENVTQEELEREVFAAAGREPTPRVVVPGVVVRSAAAMIGWSRRIEMLRSPWCFHPSPGHTTLRDGIAATFSSL